MKQNKGCPCCRQALDKSVPMIPNIAIDNTVEKHINALAISGATEWEPDGRRYMEWISRMKYVFGRSDLLHNDDGTDPGAQIMAKGSSET
jgi:hypothetical protein